MKFKRLLIILVLIALSVLLYLLVFKNWLQNKENNLESAPSVSSTQTDPQAVSPEAANPISPESAPAVASNAAAVSIFQIDSAQATALNLLGTVKAQNQIKVYAQASGQLAQVNFNSGEYVKKGDILFELQGQNGLEHTTQTQLKIAQANYENAKRGLENTKTANQSGIQLAQLQLESALDQAEGAYTDLKTFDQNIEGGQNGLEILQNSLNATRSKNEVDLEKTKRGLDDLNDAINKLNDQKYRLKNTLSSQIYQSENQEPARSSTGAETSPVNSSTVITDLQASIAQIDQKLEELYTQFENAKSGYETLLRVSDLSENQILSQIKQAQNQTKVLQLNQDSLEQKLGLDKAVPNSVELAKEGVNGTLIKNSVALSQGRTQLDLAKLNLELAQNQAANLKIIAPISGVLDKINVSSGDIISPQTILTQIISPENFELEVALSIADASKIKAGDTAELEIGGRFIPVPIKTISTVADSSTKLVAVNLALPKISFKTNQNLKARLSLFPNTNISSANDNIYIPLDALIIGSEEQYVYTVQVDSNLNLPIARKTTVKLGEIAGNQVRILEGLKKSDQVIVNGAKQLIDGQTVIF